MRLLRDFDGKYDLEGSSLDRVLPCFFFQGSTFASRTGACYILCCEYSLWLTPLLLVCGVGESPAALPIVRVFFSSFF